jgi:hypothetical protein
MTAGTRFITDHIGQARRDLYFQVPEVFRISRTLSKVLDSCRESSPGCLLLFDPADTPLFGTGMVAVSTPPLMSFNPTCVM